jgi:uncharacterized protein (DUF2267 family)
MSRKFIPISDLGKSIRKIWRLKMAQTYRRTVDHTIQVTNEWVNQMDNILDGGDINKSFHLLRATLHALRDILPLDEVAQLSAQLPIMIRGLYFEGWDPSNTPLKHRNKKDFIRRVSEALKSDPFENPEAAIEAVFSLLNARISAGEIEDVRHSLKRHLREIWPSPNA